MEYIVITQGYFFDQLKDIKGYFTDQLPNFHRLEVAEESHIRWRGKTERLWKPFL